VLVSVQLPFFTQPDHLIPSLYVARIAKMFAFVLCTTVLLSAVVAVPLEQQVLKASEFVEADLLEIRDEYESYAKSDP
jgi:hypothetical protein